MKILDRYITRNILFAFLCTIIIFFLLYLLIDSACQLDEFIDRKVSTSILIQYYLLYFPIIMVRTSFYAFLIATLLAYTNLNTHNEIVVLRSSGMSFWQIAKPAIALALIVSAAVFTVNERFVPESQKFSNRIRRENMDLEVDRIKRKKASLKNISFYGLKNRTYFIDTMNPATKEMEGITIIEYDKNTIRSKTVALRGKWTGIAWKFYQCQITYFQQGTNSPSKVKVYDEKLMDIRETPSEIVKQRVNPDSMNIQQLRDYIDRFKNSGAEVIVNRMLVDWYSKIAFPFENIVILLVGLPIALISTGRRKAQSFIALGIAIMVGFSYYFVNVVMVALGKGGMLPPIVATTIAPFLFTCIAVYIIKEKF